MKQALQSYTPTVRPLNYDALAIRTGCEPEHGNDWYGVLAFNNICVFDHDPGNAIFSQPDTVCYQLAVASLLPWNPPLWVPSAAWVATAGIRFGEGIGYVVPPADDIGTPDTLFPATVSTKVTFAFKTLVQQHYAIESSPGFINLKWLTDETGGILGNVTFAGHSPMLFNASMLDPTASVVCYYLRSDKAFRLYGRFLDDGYAIEREVIPELNVNLVRIIAVHAVGNIVKLYGIDELGRDVTLTSPAYGPTLKEKAILRSDFTFGVISVVVVPTQLQPQEKCSIKAEFIRGYMADGTGDPKHQPDQEKATITAAFEQGIISIP